MPTPLLVLCAGGMRSTLLLLLTPSFCSRLFRSGSWIGFFCFWGVLFWYFCILSKICSNCECMQLRLFLYTFFVFFCSRRHFSRCKHCSTAAKGPRSQPLSTFPLLPTHSNTIRARVEQGLGSVKTCVWLLVPRALGHNIPLGNNDHMQKVSCSVRL